MSVLSAYAVSIRLALIFMAVAALIGWRSENWAVIRRKDGWKVHLGTFVLTVMLTGGAIISSANMFPDAGWDIDRNLRLIIVNIGLTMFVAGGLTGIYRRALRIGPDAARRALLSGLAFIVPGIAFAILLTFGG